MIVSQTPLRVSFAGGGTDLRAFYAEESGAVLSAAIQKHLYVTLHRRFEPNLRVSYTRTEVVDGVADLQHGIVRECLREMNAGPPLEITTVGDVPSGTGLGSSSAVTVGLLTAIAAYNGEALGPAALAERACRVEIARLGSPIGKQDQYAAAFGGLNCIRFNPDDTVEVEPLGCTPAAIAELERHILVVHARKRGDASAVLDRQARGTNTKRRTLAAMRDLVYEMRGALLAERAPEDFGRLLHDGWLLKRSLGFGISDEGLDACYEAGRRAGAWGGKLLGAGGGGFMLFFAPPSRHAAIRAALSQPATLPFAIDAHGSRVVFKGS